MAPLRSSAASYARTWHALEAGVHLTGTNSANNGPPTRRCQAPMMSAPHPTLRLGKATAPRPVPRGALSRSVPKHDFRICLFLLICLRRPALVASIPRECRWIDLGRAAKFPGPWGSRAPPRLSLLDKGPPHARDPLICPYKTAPVPTTIFLIRAPTWSGSAGRRTKKTKQTLRKTAAMCHRTALSRRRSGTRPGSRVWAS